MKVFALNVIFTILGIENSKVYAIPYIILIIVVSIVAFALLMRFPSLKKYRRKRSIIFYTVVALLLIFLVFKADNITKRALISYNVESDYRLYPEKASQLNLTCSNMGDKSCSLYMVISSVNASFPPQSQPNYVQVNSTSVKVLFTLSERWFSMSEATESLLFNIDKNVTGFSFTIFPESWSNVVAGATHASYAWNETENCYVSDGFAGFTA